MSRPLRVQRPDAWYHLTGRGTERRVIFRTDADYQHWLELILELAERFRLQLLAYAMMPNHYHLVVAAPEMNLSRSMQWFQTSYSMWFNRKHGRVGPLFQGRFGAAVVEPGVYGLELSRYVHLNPVRVRRLGLDRPSRRAARAGLGQKAPATVIRQRLEDLRAFRWSSYRAYIGAVEPPPWLDPRPILARCAKGSLKEQRQAYRKYVEEAIREGVEDSDWEILMRQGALGSKKWIETIRKTLKGHREQPESKSLQGRPKFNEVIAAVEKVRGAPWKEFGQRRGDWGRNLAWYLGWRECALTQRQLGEASGGADYAAVSAAIKSMEAKLSRDKGLQRRLAEAKRHLKF